MLWRSACIVETEGESHDVSSGSALVSDHNNRVVSRSHIAKELISYPMVLSPGPASCKCIAVAYDESLSPVNTLTLSFNSVT